ncbi:hypothetical protein CD006_05195 [Enterobacter sp. 10-1]|nr:hypothetical protein CD006_05195 [Enterobacter sp. 10-1]
MLRVASALAALVHPCYLAMQASGDSLSCCLDASRIILRIFYRFSRCRRVGLTCSSQSCDYNELPGIPGVDAFLRREIHRACTGKDCNPQPANCLKDQYVLRHCCVDDRSDKIGHSANLLF